MNHSFLMPFIKSTSFSFIRLCGNVVYRLEKSYSTVSVMFISLTLTNVEFRMSRDFFPWILRGTSVDFA